MKRTTTSGAILFFAVFTAAQASAAAPGGVISKVSLGEGNYCHMKFPAIRERTLSSIAPELKDPSEGDVIDFYGSCSHDPLGLDEVKAQLLELQHRRARNYMD